MTDIAGVLAARDAIIQRNVALRSVAQSARAEATGAAGRGDLFAARLADAQAGQATRPDAPAPVTSAISGRDSFGSTLSSLLARVNASQATEDVATESYERGETTDIASVVLAQQRASMSFEATLQVRNKVLSAYKEVMSIAL